MFVLLSDEKTREVWVEEMTSGDFHKQYSTMMTSSVRSIITCCDDIDTLNLHLNKMTQMGWKYATEKNIV